MWLTSLWKSCYYSHFIVQDTKAKAASSRVQMICAGLYYLQAGEWLLHSFLTLQLDINRFVCFASKTIQFHCFRDPGLVEVGHLCCDLPVHSKLSSPFCYLSYRIWTLHTFVSCVPTPQPHYGLPGHNLDPSMWCGC